MEREPRPAPDTVPSTAVAAPVATTSPTGGGGPPRRPRTLLLAALAPFLLLLLLTAGIRLAGRLSPDDSGDGRDELLRRIAGGPGRRQGAPVPPPSPADPATQSAIEGTIRGQLGALGRADYRAALGFAVPEMRASWNPDDFGRMVEGGGYAVMCEAESSKVERASVRDGRQAEAHVVVTGRNGERMGFLYQLVKADGRWCIGGVTPLGPRRGGGAAGGGKGGVDPPQNDRRRRPAGPPVVDLRDV